MRVPALLLCLAAAAWAGPLEPGSGLPDFHAPAYDQDRNAVDLGARLGKGTTLLCFLPPTARSAAREAACTFRDWSYDLAARGIAVLAVGTDGPAELNAFRMENQLPFDLISDPGRDVAGLFGVEAGAQGGNAARTFLIRNGAVVWTGRDLPPKEQVKAALAYVAKALGR